MKLGLVGSEMCIRDSCKPEIEIERRFYHYCTGESNECNAKLNIQHNNIKCRCHEHATGRLSPHCVTHSLTDNTNGAHKGSSFQHANQISAETKASLRRMMITQPNRTTSALKLYSLVENYSQGIHGDDHNDANIIFNVFSTSQRLLAQRLKEIICSLSVCFILKGKT